jgi:hypothetical protein
MPSEPIGALRAELSAGHVQFANDMKKAKDAVKSNASGMSIAMDKVGKKFTEATTALNKYAGYAVAGAIVATTAFIKKQINIADEMGKLAQATGTTSEYLSSMALVASQGGTTLETVAKGVKRLSQNLYDARDGLKTSKQSFDDLGITVTDSSGALKKADQVILEIADKFKNLEDGSEKTAYAMKLFGKAGTDLIPILNGGSSGIEGLQQKAQEMGLVISTETALQAAYLNDQLDLLTKSAQGTGRSLALQLVPWLNDTFAILKYTKEESGALMASWVALGAVGDAIFGRSTQQKINELKKSIEAQEKAMGKLLPYNSPSEQKKVLESLKQQLADLETQKQKEDNADKARMEASLKRSKEEAEQRRKNTEALIKQSEARFKAAEKERIIEEAEKERIRLIELKKKALEDEGRVLTESVMTPTEIYAKTIENINMLLDEGVISQETYNRAINKAGEELNKLGEAGANVFEELGKQIEGWGRDSARAITDFALEGKGSFSDMIQSMIAEMLQMIIYQKMMAPLFNAFGGWVSGLGGATPSAHGNVFSNGKLIPFASGGIVNKPTIFPMAQGVGLMGEAGAEAIMPLTRVGGDLGVKAVGGGMVVNIINNTGSDVKTSERKTANGVELDVLIDQAVAKNIGQMGSQSNKAIRQSFGAKNQLTRR